MKTVHPLAKKTLGRAWALVGVVVMLTATISVGFTAKAEAAACSSIGADHGVVTSTVNIPATATYRVWSRLQPTKASYNTYFLEIDGNQCYWVGGVDASQPINQWNWVDYRDGKLSNKINVTLSQGTHSLKLIGNDEGLKLDRVVFASDQNCVPKTNTGTECDNPADGAAPTVKLTAPAANSTISGQVQVSATATDNTSVKKVDFYLNSSLMSSDTTSPYGFTLKTTDLSDGDYTLIAKATDPTGNVASDSYKVKVKNQSIQIPAAPANVAATADSHDTVTVSWDKRSGASGYHIYRDGVPLTQVGADAIEYEDTELVPNTTYAYQVASMHESGAESALSSKVMVTTKTVDDEDAPSEVTDLTAKAVNSHQINLKWTASVDNFAVKFYDIYRSSDSDFSDEELIAKVTTSSFGDVGLNANTEYYYQVIARDANDNQSEPSDTVKAKTPARQSRAVIYGNVRTADTRKGIAGASVVLTDKNEAKTIYTTSKRGSYIFRRLEGARYNISYSAEGFSSTSSSVKVKDKQIIRKDVRLEKR